MQFSPRFLFALLAGTAVSGCSGSLFNPSPDGDIYVTDPITGYAIVTSFAKPYAVSGLRFSIGISEAHFGGPYTLTVTNETNEPTASNGGYPYPFQFNEPCFTTTSTIPANSKTNVVVFDGSNANGQPSNYPTQPVPATDTASANGNPCHSGEEETLAISDGKGHTSYFYYEELP
ncbi:MAG: hypothetical protein IAI48_12415 [Candidatus Eremiobacteraeota bacterium]|nr:hypothetical protein [Candidatus Eremiobacteraeota bacterium]